MTPPAAPTPTRRPIPCWLLVIIALAAGFFIGWYAKTASLGHNTGTCIKADTSFIERGVTQPRCTSDCPTCMWIQN